MALRIRQDGSIWCAAMCEPQDGDLYIDDDWHYRLTAESAVIVSHPMPKHAEQGGQWWWRWEAPKDCDFRMVNDMKMTEEQIKAYYQAIEDEFEEWLNDDATHWMNDEDAAWQAWKEQEERKAHLKMAAEAEAYALDEAHKLIKQQREAIEILNRDIASYKDIPPVGWHGECKHGPLSEWRECVVLNKGQIACKVRQSATEWTINLITDDYTFRPLRSGELPTPN